MALETTRWDAADYLDDAEVIAAYLEAAIEDGDPRLIAVALGSIARSKGMTEIAKKTGITREGLYKALSAEGDPRLTTFLGVIKSLGLRISVKPATEQVLKATRTTAYATRREKCQSIIGGMCGIRPSGRSLALRMTTGSSISGSASPATKSRMRDAISSAFSSRK